MSNQTVLTHLLGEVNHARAGCDTNTNKLFLWDKCSLADSECTIWVSAVFVQAQIYDKRFSVWSHICVTG